MTIRVVELFAGVGGFRVGLEAASDSFLTVWANQWEPGKKVQWAYECYNSHFNSCVNEDINLVKNDCPEHDLLVGGFPCQDYSVAHSLTTAKGIEGKKGVLWWDIRDIVENRRPKYILLENVDRLLKSPANQRGRDFAIILSTLNELGYAVEWRVINAGDYGCAQKRRRTFIFAYHKKTDFYKSIYRANKQEIVLNRGFFSDVFECHLANPNIVFKFDLNKYVDLKDLSDNFVGDFKNGGICINKKGVSIKVEANKIEPILLGDIIERGNIDESFFLNEEQVAKMTYLRGSKKVKRVKPNGDIYYYSEGSMSPFDDLNSPARTMLTSESTVNRSTHIIMDDNRLRFLTPIECERLNGFPDDWTNTGMPKRIRYFCMGNALVVPLVTRMGEKIARL